MKIYPSASNDGSKMKFQEKECSVKTCPCDLKLFRSSESCLGRWMKIENKIPEQREQVKLPNRMFTINLRSQVSTGKNCNPPLRHPRLCRKYTI